jgi:hypothetical protein
MNDLLLVERSVHDNKNGPGFLPGLIFVSVDWPLDPDSPIPSSRGRPAQGHVLMDLFIRLLGVRAGRAVCSLLDAAGHAQRTPTDNRRKQRSRNF